MLFIKKFCRIPFVLLIKDLEEDLTLELCWSEIVAWENDWTKTCPEAIEKRKRYFETVSKQQRNRMSIMLEFARLGRDKLVNRFAYPLKDELLLESRVATTPSPRRLLDLAAVSGTTPLHVRQHFEALSLFDQSCALSLIEEEQGRRSVGASLDRMIDFLSHHLFEDESREVTVWTYHDPDDSYRVVRVGINEQHTGSAGYERMNPIICRVAKNGMPVLFHHRIKGPFGAYLKVHRQLAIHRPDPFTVRDRCGIKLVAPNVQTVYDLAGQINELMVSNGGTCHVTESNMTGNGTMDPENMHSSPYYKAMKCEIEWRGGIYELLLVTFQDYFSSLLALNDENHELYRLSQLLDISLPFLFPVSVYHSTNWDGEGLRHMLRRQKVAQLGWRVDRHGMLTSTHESLMVVSAM